MAIVLTDLRPGGGGQSVGLQVVLRLVSQPVGGVLLVPGPQQLARQLRGEVVLSEALHRHQVTPIPGDETVNTDLNHDDDDDEDDDVDDYNDDVDDNNDDTLTFYTILMPSAMNALYQRTDNS